MATDVEESDTDDHDRPSPAKRQRIIPEDGAELSKPEMEGESLEREERLSKLKLFLWQENQVRKGNLENTINRMVEDFAVNPSGISTLREFANNQMEETAVTTAIRHHGLFTGAPCVDLVPNVFDVSFPSDESRREHLPPSQNLPSCSVPFEPEKLIEGSTASVPNEERTEETDHEQDFLERAVAEAIKKKGLSAPSVDYG